MQCGYGSLTIKQNWGRLDMTVLKKSNFTTAAIRPASRGVIENPVHEHFRNAEHGLRMHHTPHFHEHHQEHHEGSLFNHPYVQEFMHQSGWEKLASICTAALALTTVSIVFLVFFLMILG